MLQLAELPLLAHAAWTRRQRRRVRGERELLAAIGNPLLAARPSRPEALRALCAQLLEHWFGAGRPLLPLISLRPGDGRTTLASELAQRFAAMGERTLLVDADLRAPSLHSIATQSATSSGRTSRFCGFMSSRIFFASSGVRFVFWTMFAIVFSVISVSTKPGQTQLTVTPVFASSAAIARVRPTSACFDAQYADTYA